MTDAPAEPPVPDTGESADEQPKSWWQKIRARMVAGTIGAVILALLIAIMMVFGGLWFNILLPSGDIGAYFPEPEGYNRTNVLVDSVTTAVGWVADLKGFQLISDNIGQFGEYADCLREEGAFDTRIYASGVNVGDEPPVAGLLALVNPERAQNLDDCTQGQNQAQSIQIRPCYGYGAFQNEVDESVYYVFVASDSALCQIFDTHFITTYAADSFVFGIPVEGERSR